MILKEHPLTYTAIQIRRSIGRLVNYKELNPNEAGKHNVDDVLHDLNIVYKLIPKEFRK